VLAQQVDICLHADEDGRIGFEVYTSSDGEDQLHSQGVVLIGSPREPETLDVAALAARCTRTLEGPQCYQGFAQAGLAYGPRFQSVRTLHVGDGTAVARLAMPAGADGEYVLHPSMMDGALQACAALLSGAG
jgi:hypothetical protein